MKVSRILRKGLSLLPVYFRHPQLMLLMRHHVHPEIWTRLNHGWFHQAKFQTVLDVGANRGQFSFTVRALLPEARIIAIDPQDRCCEEMLVIGGQDPRFEVIQSAVGDSEGEIAFNRNEFDQSSSVLELSSLHRTAFPFAARTTLETVPIQRLDSLMCNRNIQEPLFVKIDVQGYEDRVLIGGSETIKRATYVLIETGFEQLYEGEANFNVVNSLMTNLGFRYVGNLDQSIHPKTGRPIYADALFVRKS